MDYPSKIKLTPSTPYPVKTLGKRLSKGIISLFVAAFIFFLTPFFLFYGEISSVLKFQVAFTAAILALIAGFLAWSGREIKNVKVLALVSVLGSLSAALRLPFAALPSFQPCTFIIICAGYALGPAAGFLVGTLTVVISNLALGHGPWTIYQIMGWGLAGALAWPLRKVLEGSRWEWAALTLYGGLWGYVYGVITNLSFWLYFMQPTLEAFLIAEAASIWFDTVHAISNIVFLSLLGSRTVRFLYGFVGRFPDLKP